MKIRILYFALIRESIGKSAEDYVTEVSTVNELVRELVGLEPRYSRALSNLDVVRVAVDHEIVEDLETSIQGAREVAFFPPMTGG